MTDQRFDTAIFPILEIRPHAGLTETQGALLGTGFLAQDPAVAMTAAHVLSDARGGPDDVLGARIHADGKWKFLKISDHEVTNGHDLAVLQFDDNPSLTSPLRVTQQKVVDGSDYWQLSYPIDYVEHLDRVQNPQHVLT